MVTAARALKDNRLNLRVSSRQREVILEAAEATEKDLSSFVLDAAMADAQRVLADRRDFSLSDERWTAFMKAIDGPVEPLSSKPRLQKLLEQPSQLG
jgi:uncharacterized protein (DUF1778 family)